MRPISQYTAMAEDAIRALRLPEQPARLYQPISYTMASGGKRLRPVMVMMAAEAFGADPSSVINQAVGLEMFHNFTLLHDDVMDRADVRRGRPTVHVKWDDNVAILSGDAMLTLASQIIVTDAGPHAAEVLDLFNRTAMEIYEGQQWDMDFENRTDVTLKEYMTMIRLKTSVLFGCSCRLGAIMAGADEVRQQAIYDYGVNLGLAFQIQDDVLDVWADEATFGKQLGGDIACGKRTFLLINAYALADAATRAELDRLLALSPEQRDVKVEGVKAIYGRLGLRRIADAAAADYAYAADAALAGAQLSPDAIEAFQQFSALLLDRRR